MTFGQLPSPDELSAIFTLEEVRGFGPQKFKELHQIGRSPSDVLAEPELLPTPGKRGATLIAGIRELDAPTMAKTRDRAQKELAQAEELGAHILTYNDPAYPSSVYTSNNPVPVIWVRGDLGLLSERAIACVGSRHIRSPYAEALQQCAAVLPSLHWQHVSGFALGADTVGHLAAHEAGGTTIAVMPSGLAAPFPPENRKNWDQLLTSDRAVFVSEFAFNRRAASLTLRKRNKLIVAFASGVLVAQSASNGGAMNAYRFAIEQKKPVATFASDGTADTSGNDQISSEDRPGWATLPIDGPVGSFSEWLSRLS